MAQFTKLTDFSTANVFSGDDFFNSKGLHQHDWDISPEEEQDFDPEEDTWEQIDDNNLDFDEMDDLDEDLDDFHGAF